MTEHMYFNADNPFPILARGLFTEELEAGALEPPAPPAQQEAYGEPSTSRRHERIVARGYDKFFNIDEVNWTSVRFGSCMGFQAAVLTGRNSGIR